MPPLDGVRGLAAVGVLTYHTIHSTHQNWERWRGSAVLHSFFNHLGAYGVEAFFVLSGFLVGWPFLAYALGGDKPNLPRYTRARLLRIYPAWIFVVMVVVIVSDRVMLHRPLDLARVLTLTHDYFPHLVRVVISPGWTLVIEMSFYLLVPLLTLAARPLLGRVDRRYRPFVLGGTLLAVVLADARFEHWWQVENHPKGDDLRPLSYLLPIYFDRFALGMVSAIVVMQLLQRGVKGFGHFWALPILAGLTVMYLALDTNAAVTGWWATNYGPTMMATGIAILLASFTLDMKTPVARLLGSRPMFHLGRLSYGIYLWHLPLLHAGLRTGIFPRHHDTWWMVWLGLFVASCACAELSYRFIEAPALRLVDKPWGETRERLRGLLPVRSSA
jgi:peptidoglycan/LPS O-acetylase OafA/YrhL